MEDFCIAISVKGCLELFRALALLQPPPPVLIASYQTTLMAIADEESRFKVWSGNIGAHASGRRSLQFRLRDASHLQKQVLTLLTDLSSLLENALAIMKGDKVPWDQDEDEDDDISDGEPDSLEDDSGDDELPRTEMEQIAYSVSDCVNCLLRLSVALRNPAPHDRFAASFPIDVSHYEFFDIKHVRDKFQKVNGILAQKLGNAMSRRRQYFKYRESHRRKLAHGLDPEDQADGKSTIGSLVPGHAKSTGLDNTFPAINEDAVSDADISQTSFASCLTDTDILRIPPLPKSAESGPFECPFCFMIITATNRVSWKRHVFADLRPYICLSEDCTAVDKWFTRRHEWVLHEIENHWKSYVCPFLCNETFQSRSECVEHVHRSHPSTTSERQLEAMIDLSSRPIQAEGGIPCPMCHDSLDSLKKYQRHVGRHQEQLAIFALPSANFLDDEADPKDDNNQSHSDIGSDGAGAVDSERHLEEDLPSDADGNPISLPPFDSDASSGSLTPPLRSGNRAIDDSDDELRYAKNGGMDRNNLDQNPDLHPQFSNDREGAVATKFGGFHERDIPPQLLRVSSQEMMHIRSSKPSLAGVPDEQLRGMMLATETNTRIQQKLQQQQRQLQIQRMQAELQEITAWNQKLIDAFANKRAGTQGPQTTTQVQQSQPNPTAQHTQAPAMPNAMR